MTELILVSFGPREVIADEFDGIDGVQKILIFGSWASRYAGVSGRPPGDVDVLVVGSPDREVVYAAAARAEERLGLEVNATVRSLDSWQTAGDGLTRSIKDSEHLAVAGSKGLT